MGGAVLGHAWNAPTDIITFMLTVDIVTKNNNAKGIKEFLTKEKLDKSTRSSSWRLSR
jgi:hypothetical protein